jgi:hypothetical protein
MIGSSPAKEFEDNVFLPVRTKTGDDATALTSAISGSSRPRIWFAEAVQQGQLANAQKR